MKSILIFILFFFNFNLALAQHYDLIAEIFKSPDTVVFQKDFFRWDILKLNKKKVIQSWKFQSVLGGPDSKEFEKSFDIENFEDKNQNKFIDFEKLPTKFYAINEFYQSPGLDKKKEFNIISFPIFNSAEDWAIIYHQLNYHLGSGDGNLYIYRKNCQGYWKLYYTITLNFS